MKQKSKFFLVYSIALFSVALILILFSSFMGIRNKEQAYSLNNNIMALQDQNETLTKEKLEKDTQISELELENKKLENENNTLKADIAIMQMRNIVDSEKPSEAEALNGKLDAIKTALDNGEIDNAKEAISLLSGKIVNIIEFDLPNSDISRTLLNIYKEKSINNRFPRKAGVPAKNPL